MTLARFDTFVRSPIGPAAAGSQIYLCSQPAVTSNVPPNPLIQLYADPAGSTLIAQPIVADGFGHAYGYCVAGTYTVVVVLGGRVQQVYPDQLIGAGAGSSIIFQTNGVPNPVQTSLNIKGAGIATAIADGSGGVTIDVPITSSVSIQTNGVPNTSQTVLNIKGAGSVSASADGSGGVTLTGSLGSLNSVKRKTCLLKTVAIASNVLTATGDNDFQVGDQIDFFWINPVIASLDGSTGTVLTANSTGFTASITAPDQTLVTMDGGSAGIFNYTTVQSDDASTLVFGNAVDTVQVTLDPTVLTTGWSCTFTNNSLMVVTIQPNSPAYISGPEQFGAGNAGTPHGMLDISISQNQSVTLVFDGSNFFISNISTQLAAGSSNFTSNVGNAMGFGGTNGYFEPISTSSNSMFYGVAVNDAIDNGRVLVQTSGVLWVSTGDFTGISTAIANGFCPITFSGGNYALATPGQFILGFGITLDTKYGRFLIQLNIEPQFYPGLPVSSSFMVGPGYVQVPCFNFSGIAPSPDTALQVITNLFYWGSNLTFDKISFAAVNGGGTPHVAFGIYSSSGSKLWDSGPIAIASTADYEVSVTSFTLTPGSYYLAMTTDASPGGLQVFGFPSGFDGHVANQNIFGKSVVILGKAANAAASGANLPATLGAIAANVGGNTYGWPAVAFYS